MKCIVIYDTQSGNTKKMAEAIYAGIRQTGEQCDIKKMRNVVPEELANYDLIGLGSPVLHGRETYNVTAFIESALKYGEGKHGFAFCTHGALPARYLSRVVPAMTQRGLTILGWNDWFTSVFYPAVPKPYFTDGHPDDIDIKEGEDFGKEMVERSRRLYDGDTDVIPRFPRGKEYDDIYQPLKELPSRQVLDDFHRVASRLRLTVNPDKCKYPKCTLCIDNCPMNTIDFSTTPPTFGIECDYCWLCEMTCPNGAIEFDWPPYHEAHLPMVPPLQKSLEIFEARGKFRRLVPLEEVGWDTPMWTYKKPRYKIS